MKAMILAAGRGERLRPLTDSLPKPMLPVAGKPLLEHHIERLVASGITDIVINTCWLAEKIEAYFADAGARLGASIQWSRELEALETGGGIAKALPLLGNEPFLLINGDVWTDFPLQPLIIEGLPDHLDAWLVLVNNPVQHSQGDFSLLDGRVGYDSGERFTFSGISLLRPALFAARAPGDSPWFPLRDVLRPAILKHRVGGAVYTGSWCDVGTVERYEQLQLSVEQGQTGQ